MVMDVLSGCRLSGHDAAGSKTNGAGSFRQHSKHADGPEKPTIPGIPLDAVSNYVSLFPGLDPRMTTDTISPDAFAGGTPGRGRWVVIGLLVLGLASSGVIWTWWKVKLGQFVPLRTALGQAFPRSSPRAEGGPRRGAPSLLMISLDVKFPPASDDPRVRPMLDEIVEIARKNHDLAQYELLEVYLTQRLPERRQVRLRARWKTEAVLEGPEGAVPAPEITDLDKKPSG